LSVRKIDKLYVGVFEQDMPNSREKIEVIYSAIFHSGKPDQQAYSTVETHHAAVPNLVKLCDEFALRSGLAWHLILFDKNGRTELNKEIYRDFMGYCKFSA